VEGLPPAERDRLLGAVDALSRGIDEVIHEARRSVREGVGARCDAATRAVGRTGPPCRPGPAPGSGRPSGSSSAARPGTALRPGRPADRPRRCSGPAGAGRSRSAAHYGEPSSSQDRPLTTRCTNLSEQYS
jgi:hypothetical protein